MFANAMLFATAGTPGFAFYLMGALRFLSRFRLVLIHEYGLVLLAFAAVLMLNLAAVAFLVHRHFFLKDTGRKLRHVDRDLRIPQEDLP